MKHVLFILLAFFGYSVLGQTVSCKVNPKKILIGKPLEIIYTCRMDAKSVYKFSPEIGVLQSRKKTPGSELAYETSQNIEQVKAFRDTVILIGNKKVWTGTYTVTGWDEGIYSVEGQNILVDDSTFNFPSAVITVELVKEKKGKDIFDIEESFTELPDEENQLVHFLKNYWWILLLLILGIGFFIYRRWKNNQIKTAHPASELSLKERTLIAIDLLEKERMWEKGKLKEHYIELSFILRSYLSSRYDLNLLENTTREAQLLLTHKGLHTDTIQVIGSVLDQSDMVKFARSAPLEMEVLKVSQKVRQIVAETSPIEFEHGG